MSRDFLIMGVAAFLAVLLVPVAAWAAAGDGPPALDGESGRGARVGGPCTYASYGGTARIIRIAKSDASRNQAGLAGGPGYEGYEIWFRFAPEEGVTIGEWPAQAIGQERLLTLQNGWYPGPRFLKKYELVEGGEYPCTLKVIEKGTCTPIIFDFPTIDTADYFESAK